MSGRGAGISRVYLLALVSLAACKREISPGPIAAYDAAVGLPERADAAASTQVQDAGNSVQNALVPQYAGDSPMATWRSAKGIGHTSTVYLLKGDNDQTRMVFKPDTRHGPGRYRGEIAARQLALAFGIGDRVPQVVSASFERGPLRGVLPGPKARADFDADVMAQGDFVYGAGIAWVDGLQFPALHRGPARAEWEGWITGKDPVPAEKRELAKSISDMVMFDYITGNFDRWSGGNIGQVGNAHSPVLYIDNDGAFLWPEPREHLERQAALMRRTSKFSERLSAPIGTAAVDPQFAARVLTLPPPLQPFGPELLRAVQRRLVEVAAHMQRVCDAGPCVIL